MSVTLKQKYDLYKKVRANPGISSGGKVLFEYLLIQCLNCRTLKCHPGRDTIVKATGTSLTTVKRLLAELKKAGVLRWRSGKTGRSNEYHFPGLSIAATERNASDCPRTSADQIMAPSRAISGPEVGPNPAHQHRREHRIEHSPSKGRANAAATLKGFDGEIDGRGFPVGWGTREGFYASGESPQRKAWDAFGRAVNGKSYPHGSDGGWRFPTEWPPGFEQAA